MVDRKTDKEDKILCLLMDGKEDSNKNQSYVVWLTDRKTRKRRLFCVDGLTEKEEKEEGLCVG